MDNAKPVSADLKDVHPTAISGYNQDAAEMYDSRRPDYSEETITEIIERSKINSIEPIDNIGADILELGAGTGKFTKPLHSKLKQPLKYIATDPSDGFLKTINKHCPDVQTVVCSADNLPFPDSSVRFVIGAQCFHWFATEACLREIHRVLVPDGMLILVWNRRDVSLPWVQVTSDLLHEYYPPDVPREVSGKWKEAFEKFMGFKQRFHIQPSGPAIKGNRQRIADYFMTISVIASLSENERKDVAEKFKKLIAEHLPETTTEETLVLPFITNLYGFVKE